MGKYRQFASPQEELARNAADFRRGLRVQFGDALSDADAEDIVQTALMVKVPSTDDGRNARQRGAWFARVVHTTAIDFIRERDGRNRDGGAPRQMSLELIDEMYAGEAETAVPALRVDEEGFDADRLDREFDRETIQALARRALRRLSREDRRMISLRYRDGLSNAQVADELGMSVKGLEKRWARAWVAFVTEAAGDDVAGETCASLRLVAARRPFGHTAEATARWEAHLQECPACRVWAFVGAQAAGALPSLPLGGGIAASLLGKVGLGGLLERLHATGEQIATAVGGGAGAGAGVLSAVGTKAAATCITAAVCVSAGAYVTAPVVERAVSPDRHEHRDKVASKTEGTQAAGASGAQRPTITTGSASASVAPATPAARQALSTQTTVQPTPTARTSTRPSAKLAREKAQARAVRASASPFTPEAGDPTPTNAAAPAPTPSAEPATPPPAPDDSSRFSGEFSP